MDHKELTFHIRNRIKAAGIKAKVKMDVNCGYETIRVDVASYGAEFSEAEQYTLRLIAKTNRLTLSQGMEIQLEQMTDPFGMVFYIPKEV